MSSGTETPLATASTQAGGKTAPETVVGSPDPVYRIYLSPPPPAPMQPGLATAGAVGYPQQQAMYQSPLGLLPYNPYMPLSPPSMGGVSAFAQPAYYAHQPMFYPQQAYGMPAVAGVQPRVSTLSTLSSSNGSASSHGPAAEGARFGGAHSHHQQPQEAGEHDVARARTPLVNEAGAAMGGFGADQDGQYIEIKFPTFGQVQMQQMLQQLHIHQQAQMAQAATTAVCSPCGIHQPQPVAAVPPPVAVDSPPLGPKQQQSLPLSIPQQQQQQQQLPTPVSTTPAAVSAAAAISAAAAAEKIGLGTSVSIYDAETFASTHMEDIVFDNKAFFWKIANWDKLERRATSDVFRCGGHIWRILLRPFGSSHKGVLSLFLECLGTSDASDDWRCTCRFVLAIANPHDPTHNTHGSAYHCFHRNNPNWGFTRFMKLADLRTASAPGVRPYIEDGACTISAYLHVIKEPSQ